MIPARGGSKRIPRKNLKPFAGRPIIAYSIAAARECGLFDHILVSTDDAEIARVAEEYGASAPFVRPAHLSDDHASSAAVVAHAVQWAVEHLGEVGFVCCIYATAPFLRPESLRQGYDRLVASGKSYAFSVTSFPFPIQRAVRINGEGCIEMFHPEHYLTRSQDLEPAYHDAAQFYWGRAASFLKGEMLFSPVSVPVVLPRHEVQDIDTGEDWERAELMYRAWRETAKDRE